MPNKKDGAGKKRMARDREDFQENYARAYEEFRDQQSRLLGSAPRTLSRKKILSSLKNRYTKGSDDTWRLIEN
jgi:cation transport regulator ChaB